MYAAMDAELTLASLLFVFVIIVANFLIINMSFGVIFVVFSSGWEKYRAKRDQKMNKTIAAVTAAVTSDDADELQLPDHLSPLHQAKRPNQRVQARYMQPTLPGDPPETEPPHAYTGRHRAVSPSRSRSRSFSGRTLDGAAVHPHPMHRAHKSLYVKHASRCSWTTFMWWWEVHVAAVCRAKFAPLIRACKTIALTTTFEVLSAALIMCLIVIMAFDTEEMSDDTRETYNIVQLSITIAFTIEVFIRFVATHRFFSSAVNCIDTVIVLVSLIAIPYTVGNVERVSASPDLLWRWCPLSTHTVSLFTAPVL